uniref:Major-capsid protein n=1 Tax=Malaco herpesvirus 4 TaxID=3031800 RepID=A0AA48SIM7_9VIRU|nr:TPA_asm: major-capsid protein [Malaco herpesvirus 4]
MDGTAEDAGRAIYTGYGDGMEAMVKKTVDSIIRGVETEAALSQGSFDAGLVRRHMKNLISSSLSSDVAQAIAKYATNMAMHTNISLEGGGIGTLNGIHAGEQNKRNYDALLTQCVHNAHNNIFRLARDPNHALSTMLLEAQSTIDVIHNMSGTENVATVDGVPVGTYIFMGENVMTTLLKHEGTTALPIQTGTFIDVVPLFYKPLEAFKSEPDMARVNVIHLHRQPKNPLSTTLNDLKHKEGFLNNANDIDMSRTSKNLTDLGRQLLGDNAREMHDRNYTETSENVLCYIPIKRTGVKYVKFGGAAHVIETMPTQYFEPTSMIHKRIFITSVSQFTFNHDADEPHAWIRSMTAGQILHNSTLPRKMFSTKRIFSETPGMSADSVVFGPKEASFAFMDPTLQDVSDNTIAMNTMLTYADRLAAKDGEVLFVKRGLNQMLTACSNRDELYTTYWENTDYSGQSNSVGQDAKEQLMRVEFTPFHDRVAEKSTPGGKTVFGVRKRTVVGQIPKYVLPEHVLEQRGIQLCVSMHDPKSIDTALNSLREFVRGVNLPLEFKLNSENIYKTSTELPPDLAKCVPNFVGASIEEDFTNEKVLAKFESLLKTVTDDLIKAYTDTYPQLQSDDGLKEMSYIFDTNTVTWRVLAHIVLPVIAGPDRLQMSYLYSDTVHESSKKDAGCANAVTINTPKDGLNSMVARVPPNDEDSTLNYINVSDSPMNNVMVSNIHWSLLSSKLTTVHKAAIVFMLFEYTSPVALNEMTKSKITPPVEIDWILKDTIISDDVMVSAPKSMSVIQSDGKIDCTQNTTDNSLRIHYSCNMQSSSNSIVTGSVLFRTVQQNPLLNKNCTNTDTTPRLSMDGVTRSKGSNVQAMFYQLKENGHVSSASIVKMSQIYGRVEKENSNVPYDTSSQGVDKNCNAYIPIFKPHCPPSNKPHPIMGIPLFKANTPGENPWKCFYFDQPAVTSVNPWMSTFGSRGMMQYTKNLMSVSIDSNFLLYTTCFAHARTTVTPTTAILEDLYNLSISVPRADMVAGEREAVINSVIGKDEATMRAHAGSTGNITINGVSFLNPVPDLQQGELDFPTTMGYATPATQFTDHVVKKSVEEGADVAKLKPKSIRANPVIIPGGSTYFNKTRGPMSYYVRSTFSGNLIGT